MLLMEALYRNLGLTDIQLRLLRVIRSGDEQQEVNNSVGNNEGAQNTLRCELAVFSLRSRLKPFYKALSYCWGDEKATRVIRVNGQPCPIRPNLHNFLQRYASVSGSPGEGGWLFVDALCINQQDLEERKNQVQLMGDIYRGATEVIAWLGIEGDIERDFDKHAMTRYVFHQDLDLWQTLFDEVHFQMVFLSTKRASGGPIQNSKGPKTLIEILEALESAYGEHAVSSLVIPLVNRPLWTRLWIVQEILLARHLVFWYKTLQVSWDVLHACLQYGWAAMLARIPLSPSQIVNVGTILRAETAPVKAYYFLEERRKANADARVRRMDLSTAIVSFASQGCADPHDKVYGLLGLTMSIIKVNYKDGIDTLYSLALSEGLLEIYYRTADSHQRRMESAQFTVSLARELGQNLHDSLVWLKTQEALKMIGTTMNTASVFWVQQVRLRPSAFTRLGKLGRKVYPRVCKLLHDTAAANAAFENFCQRRPFEKPVSNLCEAVNAKRFPTKRQYRLLTAAIPNLPVMNLAEAEALVLKITSFPDHAEGLQLAKEATRVLETELSTLSQIKDDPISEEHARRLEAYRATLTRYTDQTLALQNLPLSEPDDSRRDLPRTTTQTSQSTNSDVETILQFMVNPDFNRKLSKHCESIQSSPVGYEVMIYQVLLEELLKALGGHNQPEPSGAEARRSVLEFWKARIADTDFRDFLLRTINSFTDTEGSVSVRSPGDPAYKGLEGFSGLAVLDPSFT